MQTALNFNSRDYTSGKTANYKVGVFGSRSLDDERIELILLEWFDKLKPTKILTCQEPGGVSEVAQRVCKKYGYPLQLHFLNMQYLRGAFEQRSIEIVKEADFFLIIHDGESRGTANEMKLVQKHKKPFEYIKVEKSQYTKSVGFNITDEWGKDSGKWDEI